MPPVRSNQKTGASEALSCTICNKTFPRRYELKRHMAIHDPNKYMHPCPVGGCTHKALQKSNLRAHVAAKHDKTKDYFCRKCGRGFADNSAKIRHERALHGILAKAGKNVAKASTDEPSTSKGAEPVPAPAAVAVAAPSANATNVRVTCVEYDFATSSIPSPPYSETSSSTTCATPTLDATTSSITAGLSFYNDSTFPSPDPSFSAPTNPFDAYTTHGTSFESTPGAQGHLFGSLAGGLYNAYGNSADAHASAFPSRSYSPIEIQFMYNWCPTTNTDVRAYTNVCSGQFASAATYDGNYSSPSDYAYGMRDYARRAAPAWSYSGTN